MADTNNVHTGPVPGSASHSGEEQTPAPASTYATPAPEGTQSYLAMSDPNNKLIDPAPNSAACSDNEQMPPPTPATPAPGRAGLEPHVATVTQGALTTSSSLKTGSPLPDPSGSTSDTVVKTMLSTTTHNDGASRPKKKKAKLMRPGVTTTARYVYYNILQTC
jgi:hypothetical protein